MASRKLEKGLTWVHGLLKGSIHHSQYKGIKAAPKTLYNRNSTGVSATAMAFMTTHHGKSKENENGT